MFDFVMFVFFLYLLPVSLDCTLLISLSIFSNAYYQQTSMFLFFFT